MHRGGLAREFRLTEIHGRSRCNGEAATPDGRVSFRAYKLAAQVPRCRPTERARRQG